MGMILVWIHNDVPKHYKFDGSGRFVDECKRAIKHVGDLVYRREPDGSWSSLKPDPDSQCAYCIQQNIEIPDWVKLYLLLIE